MWFAEDSKRSLRYARLAFWDDWTLVYWITLIFFMKFGYFECVPSCWTSYKLQKKFQQCSVIFYKHYAANSKNLFNFGLWATKRLDPGRPVLPIQYRHVQYLSLCSQSSVFALQVMANSRSCFTLLKKSRQIRNCCSTNKSYDYWICTVNFRATDFSFQLLSLWARVRKQANAFPREKLACLLRFLMTF